MAISAILLNISLETQNGFFISHEELTARLITISLH